jgi:hypothetical protein
MKMLLISLSLVVLSVAVHLVLSVVTCLCQPTVLFLASELQAVALMVFQVLYHLSVMVVVSTSGISLANVKTFVDHRVSEIVPAEVENH